MCNPTSKNGFIPRTGLAWAVAAAAATGLAACGELAAPPRPKDPLSNQLIVYALLLPDTSRHHVLIAAADGIARPELSGVKLTIYRRAQGVGGAEWALVGQWQDPYQRDCGLVDAVPLRNNLADRGRYCFNPELRVEAGVSYRVEVTAAGRSPAWGETQAVGDFEITEAALASGSLSAEWTSSSAAHRYFVGLRRVWDPTCGTCERAWYADVDGTRFDGAVPPYSVEAAGQNPILEVVAVDRRLHAFLTTGHEGSLHDIHPVQNVTGGFGVVGSMLSRGRLVERR